MGIELTHGSLLITLGDTRANRVHQVPETAGPIRERLNLTFRTVVAASGSS